MQEKESKKAHCGVNNLRSGSTRQFMLFEDKSFTELLKYIRESEEEFSIGLVPENNQTMNSDP